MSLLDNIAVAWDVLKGGTDRLKIGPGNSYSPNMSAPFVRSTADSFSSAAFNRIALDASNVEFRHVKIDTISDKETKMKSELNDLMGLDANIDQTFSELIQEGVKTLFSEGTMAIVPIQVEGVTTLRIAWIRQWYPKAVEVDVWNEKVGQRQQMYVNKSDCAIIQNPLYAVANGPNATLRRLIEKMNQIDQVEAIMASGKLDLILQLPNAVDRGRLKEEASERLELVSQQLKEKGMGMAYIGTNEKITQLNRPVSDTLLPQIESLTKLFHNQLGLSEAVLDGTAGEAEMRSYYSRTIDPILKAIIEGMAKAFLTKTARTQGQKIVWYRDPFSLVPMSQLPDLLDKISRNEIATPNESRRIIGLKPSEDPEADILKNRNMAAKETQDKPSGTLIRPDWKSVKMGTNTDKGEIA